MKDISGKSKKYCIFLFVQDLTFCFSLFLTMNMHHPNIIVPTVGYLLKVDTGTGTRYLCIQICFQWPRQQVTNMTLVDPDPKHFPKGKLMFFCLLLTSALFNNLTKN